MESRNAFVAARRELAYAHESGASLCEPFLSVVPVTGAAISVLATPAAQTTVCASDAVAARLDELQFDLAEGPSWEAMRTQSPSLHPNLRDEQGDRWPQFAEVVRAEPVGAMYAFPMLVGSLELGAVDLYSTTPRALTTNEVADAASLATIAGWQVLRRLLADEGDAPLAGGSSRHEVHQATGMVLAQLNISAHDAELLLRAHAFAQGRSVQQIANDIVERRLTFTSDPSAREAAE